MGKSWPDRLLAVGAFMLFFGAYLLFLKGPAANEQQQYFRIGVVAFGFILGVVGLILKAKNNRGDDGI
jgi:drug/metabolite transporter (DMT)-like permease